MLVDSHCHLDFPDFDEDRDDLIARAEAAGVGLMVTISTKLSAFEGVRAIAERYPNVYCSVGVHPHEAGAEQASAEELTALAAHPKVVGIGETGLDFHYDNSSRDAQTANLEAHIIAARETGLPLIVHTRDADDETIRQITGAVRRDGPFPGLIHCFTAGAELARAMVEIGFYISFSGILTFKNAGTLRETAKTVPLDRILVETDSPYLAPVPNRGRRNEPAFTAHTAAAAAELRGLSPEAFAEMTTDNFFRLFTKIPDPRPHA
ncbi:MAG: TatD family hydrolase [Rhodospirillales bacterium]